MKMPDLHDIALVDGLLLEAERLARASNPRAKAAYEKVLAIDAGRVEARVALARIALSEGQPAQALDQMRQACAVAPDNAQLWKSLAAAAEAVNEHEEAIAALRKAIALAPAMYLAQLQLGKLLERKGDRYGTTRAYFRAVTQAQFAEQWLDLESIPPRLRADVLHAMEFVRQHRVSVLSGLLDPLRERFGGAALHRIERGFSSYLGVSLITPPDPAQRPKFLYIPDLPYRPFFPRDEFDWIGRLEAAFAPIRKEAERALADESALRPFLDLDEGQPVDDYLAGAEVPPRWDAMFFYRHGCVFPDSGSRFPATSRTLESLPLIKIEGHAPEICFSVLSAGTHILPHHGVSNVRVVVHLPLIVPEKCALRVAGKEHAWKEGECVVFDDTYLHEAWNRSERTRVILLMDAWNPHLTDVERVAISELIEGIGDFHRA